MSKQFKEKVVWITGGGTGIGRAIAEEFGRQGAIVVVSGRRKARLDEVVALISRSGGIAHAEVCDVTRVTDIEATVARIVEQQGRLDVAIANAGFGVGGRIEDLTAADWHRQFDTNVIGLAMTAKYALPELRKSAGRLVLMGSVAGTIGLPGTGAYSASKFAVRSIGQTLDSELAGSAVSVTTIQPGFVESEIGQVDNQGVYREEWTDKRPAKWMWPADKAARVMVKAIADRKREEVVTGHGKAVAFLAYHAPGVVQALIRKTSAKRR